MTFDEWCAQRPAQLTEEEQALVKQAYLAGYAACLENVQRFERKLAQAQRKQRLEEVDYDL